MLFHFAVVTFLSVAAPALVLIAAFTARTKPQAFLLMPIAEPTISISEVETTRMKSVK